MFSSPTHHPEPKSSYLTTPETEEELEELDLLSFSDTDDDSPCPRRQATFLWSRARRKDMKTLKMHTKIPATRDTKGNTAKEVPRRIASLVIKPDNHQVSYRDALVRQRTFKPRFPHDPSRRGDLAWLHEQRRRPRLKHHAGSSRTCPLRSGHVASLPRAPPLGAARWLSLLKAKAGNRCFNCFASDHRIGECR